MLHRYKEHKNTVELQREEAEPVQASDWRYTGDSLEPKATAKCSLKLVQKEIKIKTRHNSLLLNDLTNTSIQKLQAIFFLLCF